MIKFSSFSEKKKLIFFSEIFFYQFVCEHLSPLLTQYTYSSINAHSSFSVPILFAPSLIPYGAKNKEQKQTLHHVLSNQVSRPLN
jgi:hypothetical protein